MINCQSKKKARYDAWEEDIAALNIFFGKETVKGHFRLLQNHHKIFPHLKSKDLSGIDFYLDSILNALSLHHLILRHYFWETIAAPARL